MNYLNISTIRECTTAEGPGKRFSIWVQGCLKRCKNCCNQDMQELRKNKIVSTQSIINKIEQAKNEYDIEGITLLGGEPTLQAKGLSEIVKWCKSNDLSVMLFTGYLYEELLNSDNEYLQELISYTDVIVDGEFKEELYDSNRAWVGSSNQKIYFLTDIYKGDSSFFTDRKVEFLVTKDNILINGWPF